MCITVSNFHKFHAYNKFERAKRYVFMEFINI